MLEVHLDADAELAVDGGVACGPAEAQSGRSRASGFLFIEKVEAPVPARRQFLTQQKPEFVCVGRGIIELSLNVQSGIQRYFAPIGQCPSRLDLISRSGNAVRTML